MCKEMPLIQVNKVVYKKRIVDLRRRRDTRDR
jgi:hypothetical protein